MHWCTKNYPTSARLKSSWTSRVAQGLHLMSEKLSFATWEMMYDVYIYINEMYTYCQVKLWNFQVEGSSLSILKYIYIYMWFAFAIFPHLTSRNAETVWYNKIIRYNHHVRLCIHGNPRVPPPQGNKALTRPYWGMMVVNNPLIRPYFLGRVALGGPP